MTQEQMDGMIERTTAAANTPLIMLQCGMPKSAQETANGFWQELGDKMGFNSMTVEPDPDGNPLCFIAEPKEA